MSENLEHNQQGFSAVEAVLVLVIIGIVGFAGWYVMQARHNADQSLSNANTSTQSDTSGTVTASTLATFTDTAKAYTISYPKDWTLGATDGSGLENQAQALLDSKFTTLTPPNLSAEEKNNVYVSIASFSISDGKSIYPLGVNQKINGYDAVYYQQKVAATPGENGLAGGMGYTEDQYAITHGGVTVTFYFREKQDGNGIANSFDVSKLTPTFTKIVKSIKFLNDN